MTVMESIFALSFVAALAAAIVLLRRAESFRRFLLVAVVPLVVFSAFWNSLFQMRIYSLRYPLLPPPATIVASPAASTQ